MANKELTTRIQLRYDTLAEWTKIKDDQNKILKAGEVAAVYVPSGTTTDENGKTITTAPTVLFKVGDGGKKFGELPWLSALAADVHSWAKKTESEFRTWLSTALTTGDVKFVTEQTWKAFELELGSKTDDSTKDTIYGKIAESKSIASEAFSKANTNAQTLLNKANTSDVYSKTDADNTFETIANVSQISGRVSTLETNSATKTEVNQAKEDLIGKTNDDSSKNTIRGAKKYADEKVAALVSGAPETLDTLDELAAALKDNADIVTVLNQSIGNKANSSDLSAHLLNTSNPHKVTADQVGAYTKGEVDDLIEALPDTNTTYTFSNGTDGTFTVTPKGGQPQTVNTGISSVTNPIKDDLAAYDAHFGRTEDEQGNSIWDVLVFKCGTATTNW